MSQTVVIPIFLPRRGRATRRRRPRSWWRSVYLRYRHLRSDPWSGRARRVVLLLILLWVLNLFDLAFTIMATEIGNFQELNPFARDLLHAPAALAMYKLTLMLFATIIFLRFYHRRLTEVVCWGLAGVFTCLAVVWLRYFYVLTG